MSRAARRHGALAAVLLAAATLASASPELARQHACMGCHALSDKLVGPSFADVAARYAGKPAAVDTIAKAIRAGSKSAWGEMAMPAQPQLSVQDAETLARWVMQTAPAGK